MPADDWSDICDFSISDKTVIRISRKTHDGVTFLDVRKMGRDKKGNLFRTYKGLCLRAEFWDAAIKKFTDSSYFSRTYN